MLALGSVGFKGVQVLSSIRKKDLSMATFVQTPIWLREKSTVGGNYMAGFFFAPVSSQFLPWSSNLKLRVLFIDSGFCRLDGKRCLAWKKKRKKEEIRSYFIIIHQGELHSLASVLCSAHQLSARCTETKLIISTLFLSLSMYHREQGEPSRSQPNGGAQHRAGAQLLRTIKPAFLSNLQMLIEKT